MRIPWARLPRDDSGGGGGTMRRVHLDRAPGRGTHTIRFALSQSHSPAESKRRQRYIERDGACAASFGNIGDTEEERDRRWGALAGFGVSRSRRIELGPGTAPNIKRPALARLLGSDDALPGGMEPSRIQYLSELDNDELVRRKISFRTPDPDTHTQWLEHIARAIEDADATPELPGNRSRLDPTLAGPEDRPPLAPGVRIKGGREAALVVTNDTPPEALRALATLVEGEAEHLIDPPSAAALAAWHDDRPAGQDTIIRAGRTDVVDYLAKESNKVGQLAEDNEQIKVGSRPGIEEYSPKALLPQSNACGRRRRLRRGACAGLRAAQRGDGAGGPPREAAARSGLHGQGDGRADRPCAYGADRGGQPGAVRPHRRPAGALRLCRSLGSWLSETPGTPTR